MRTLTKRTPIILVALIILWFFAWVSTPESAAVKSSADIEGYVEVKIAIRLAIVSLILILLILFTASGKGAKSRAIYTLHLPSLYIIWNLVVLPRSAEPFYSIFRIGECAAIWLTALLFVNMNLDDTGIGRRIGVFFNILSVACLVLIVLYFVAPEWGSKPAGFDSMTGEMTSRLGGSALRVDLAAHMGGAVLLFWLFAPAKGAGHIGRWIGILAGAGVAALAHSRSVIVLILGLIVFSLFRKTVRPVVLLVLASVMVTVFISMDMFLDFLLRHSDIDSLGSLNGRLLLWESVWELNDWSTMLIGNGYLMNSPDGLEFWVAGMGRVMDSPHNGYLSAFLGSGVIGIAIILGMYKAFWRRSRRISGSLGNLDDSIILTVLFLCLVTALDYGVWGVTSPAMLIFAVLYSAVLDQSQRPRTA